MSKQLQYLIAVVCLSALALLAYQTRETALLVKERDHLVRQLTDKSENQSLDLQGRCADQAVKVWHQMGWDQPTKDASATYETHYNTKSRKCFMSMIAVVYTKQGTSTQRTLLDAFEQKIYGEYATGSYKDTGIGEDAPFQCRMTPSSAEENHCKTKGEFLAFVASYME